MNNLNQDVQNIWDNLTPEDIEYVKANWDYQFSPFATLHDVCDANMLLPDLPQAADGSTEMDEWLTYANQVMEEFNRQFVAKYPKSKKI